MSILICHLVSELFISESIIKFGFKLKLLGDSLGTQEDSALKILCNDMVLIHILPAHDIDLNELNTAQKFELRLNFCF